MSVRAKFKVVGIERTEGKCYTGNPDEVQYIRLYPVCNNNSENAKFYAATPSGEIRLTVVHKEVGDQFKLGKEYYVDFTEASC